MTGKKGLDTLEEMVIQTSINFDDQPRTKEFSTYLKERCGERGVSLHKLAIRCGLNEIYFYQAVKKNKENPPPWVLRRVAHHLDVPYIEILIAAGYLEEEDIRQWRAFLASTLPLPPQPGEV